MKGQSWRKGVCFILCLTLTVLFSACGSEAETAAPGPGDSAVDSGVEPAPSEAAAGSGTPRLSRDEASAELRESFSSRRESMLFYGLFSQDISTFYADYGGNESETHPFGNCVDIAVPLSESVYFRQGGDSTTPASAASELLAMMLEDVRSASAAGSDFFYRLIDFEVGSQSPLDWDGLLENEIDGLLAPFAGEISRTELDALLGHEAGPGLLPLGENMWLFTPEFSYEYSGIAEMRESAGAAVEFQGTDIYILMRHDMVWRLQSLDSLVKMFDAPEADPPILGENIPIPDNIVLPDGLSTETGPNGELLLRNSEGEICGTGAALNAGTAEFEDGRLVSLAPLVNHSSYTTPLVPTDGGAVVRAEFDVYDDERGAYTGLDDAYWCSVSLTEGASGGYVLLLSADMFTLGDALAVLGS